jgi:tmRNA-binding protein
MKRTGIKSTQKRFFIPPYEWYNDSMAAWSNELGITLINFTPGTLSNTDYTIPSMRNYQSTETIYNSIINYERKCPDGLNGFLLLIHIGTDPERTDKFYYRLDELIGYLRHKGYSFVRIETFWQKIPLRMLNNGKQKYDSKNCSNRINGRARRLSLLKRRIGKIIRKYLISVFYINAENVGYS